MPPPFLSPSHLPVALAHFSFLEVNEFLLDLRGPVCLSLPLCALLVRVHVCALLFLRSRYAFRLVLYSWFPSLSVDVVLVIGARRERVTGRRNSSSSSFFALRVFLCACVCVLLLVLVPVFARVLVSGLRSGQAALPGSVFLSSSPFGSSSPPSLQCRFPYALLRVGIICSLTHSLCRRSASVWHLHSSCPALSLAPSLLCVSRFIRDANCFRSSVCLLVLPLSPFLTPSSLPHPLYHLIIIIICLSCA